MSGHNKWSQIKNQKGAADKKRGLLFSKLLKAIAIAAKGDPNPQFNPRLRSAIDQAKKANVPLDTIDRAVSKASEEKSLEDVVVEAYGPEGVALIIEGITDNTNRTIAEIKHLLTEHQAKIANPGSVLWSFEKKDGAWQAKFPQAISDAAKAQVAELVEVLNDHDDVQLVTTNAAN